MTGEPARPGDAASVPAGDSATTETEALSNRFPGTWSEHYTGHPSGVECIQITEHMNFNLGNATKYIWRAGLKSDDAIQDLEKAAWYVAREIARLKGSR